MKDGGPAFPRPYSEDEDGYPREANEGISMRDYFAAKAMQGLLTSPHAIEGITPSVLARQAYILADAMLKEGEGENEAVD